MTPYEALLSFWADVDSWFEASPNPLGRGLSDEEALRVCRGGLGQIRRWVEQYRAVLHEGGET